MDVNLKNWKRKSLPEEELRDLISLAQSGDIEARNKVVEDTLWIVGTVNLKYRNTEDGFQQGVLGLINAIEKFDINTKSKFSTYAYYWVRQKIGKYISKEVYKTSYDLIYLFKELQNFPGTEAEFFKTKKLNVRTILALDKMSRGSEAELKEYGGKDNSSMVEINNFLLKEYVDDLLKKNCTEKEEYILRKIFFEEDGTKALMKEFNWTKQYVSFTKNKILQKLRKVIYEDNNY